MRALLVFIALAVTLTANAYTSLTRSALMALIGSNALNIGEWYSVSDRNSYTVLAISSNLIANDGYAVWPVPDYQNIGTYSPPLNLQLGVWKNTFIVVANDVVIWNGYHWQNISGSNSMLPPDLSPSDWSQLMIHPNNGYIFESVSASYDIQSDIFYRVLDKRLNDVSVSVGAIGSLGNNPVDWFQFGCDSVVGNTVTNGLLDNLNQTGFIACVSVDGLSAVESNDNNGRILLSSFSKGAFGQLRDNKGYIAFNEIVNGGILEVESNRDTIAYNFVKNPSSLVANRNKGKIDGHYLFQGYLSGNDNCDTCDIRSFAMFHGSSAFVDSNMNVIGATFMTIGATLKAERNKGDIAWLTLSNTVVMNSNGNAGTVRRMILGGNYTYNVSMAVGRVAFYNDVFLNKDYTVDGSIDFIERVIRPFNY